VDEGHGFEQPPLSFQELKQMVGESFTLLDAYLDARGVPTFLVANVSKLEFKALTVKLEKFRLIPMLRRVGDSLVLRVFMKPPKVKTRSVLLNFLLLAVTLGTIYLAGYYGFISTPVLSEVLMKDANVYFQSATFAISLFGIIGLHELGHLMACRIHGMDFSLPYFIPGPPPFGTFGAVVSLRSPPKNRDELFDTGFAGPLAGFLATIIVSVISLRQGFLVPVHQAAAWAEKGWVKMVGWPMIPLIFELLQPLVRPIPPGFNLILTHVEFAAWVGALVTFLNILPVWQLDGGHISRAMWGEKGHRYASLVGLGVLFATGYWFFALFLLFWMLGSRRGWSGAEPLDDVSPLSPGRRLLYPAALIILGLSFVVITSF
jgi:Zn-dependent protease